MTTTSELHCGPTKVEVLKYFIRRELINATAKIFARGHWLTPDQYRTGARQSAKIDYGCEFIDGKCKQQRHKSRNKWDMGDWRRGEMACCGGCAGAWGYLYEIPSGTAAYFARRFNLKTGFWRAGKGCILLREHRSPTCLAFNCSNAQSVQDAVSRLFQITNATTIN